MSNLRDKRQQLISDYISDHSYATQNEIIDHIVNETDFLKDDKATISQSTVLRDLKFLGYEKIDGKYIKGSKRRESEQVSMLKKLFTYDEPLILAPSTKVFQVIISTKKGMEKSIGDLISQVYENQILGTITGNGCVMILTTDKQKANDISDTLQSYLSDDITL